MTVAATAARHAGQAIDGWEMLHGGLLMESGSDMIVLGPDRCSSSSRRPLLRTALKNCTANTVAGARKEDYQVDTGREARGAGRDVGSRGVVWCGGRRVERCRSAKGGPRAIRRETSRQRLYVSPQNVTTKTAKPKAARTGFFALRRDSALQLVNHSLAALTQSACYTESRFSL